MKWVLYVYEASILYDFWEENQISLTNVSTNFIQCTTLQVTQDASCCLNKIALYGSSTLLLIIKFNYHIGTVWAMYQCIKFSGKYQYSH
jgi:hypothetical protein